MANRILSRWQASGLHLLISVAVATTVLAVVYFLWFPGPLFEAGGGNRLVEILVSVDVSLGPLITLAVYKHGKWGMKFDLTVIAILQIVAFSYGMHVIYKTRPAFIVFAKDQFEVATVGDISAKDYAQATSAQFRQAPWGGPKFAFAQMPTDPKERNALVLAAMGGKDIDQMPKYFRPYPEHAADVLKKSWTLARLRKEEPPTARIIDTYMARSTLKDANVRFVRLRALRAWVGVLIDARTAEPVKMLITEKD